MNLEIKKHYTSTGLVYGNYWGGGKGGYSARKLQANTKEELIELAKKGIEDGSLDSGMGYESLIGCMLEITVHETVEIDGKEFVHKTEFFEYVGDEITEEEENFLMSCMGYIPIEVD